MAVVRPGTMLFEVGGVSDGVALQAMRTASSKLPIRTRFVRRHG